ncbi:MAG: polyprenol monophosphomannose synthase [Thermoproteota archaeon]
MKEVTDRIGENIQRITNKSKQFEGFTPYDVQLSILLPTYMEAETLPKLIEELEKILKHINFEIIVIDDNSPDGTAEVAEKLRKKFKNVNVIRRYGKFGLGSAVVEGLRVARAKLIVVMDADLQHPPEVLPIMLKKLKEGYEVVIASRYVEGGKIDGLSLWRRLISKGATVLAHLLFPKIRCIADPLSGYFAFDKDTIHGVELNPISYKILLEILIKGRYTKFCEVPYSFRRRTEGRSKFGLHEMLHYLRHLYALVKETKKT